MSSKHLLDKYEYFTGEDLEYEPNVFEKAKFVYFSLGMSLNEAFKRDEAKCITKTKIDFYYDSRHTFFEFYKRIEEFKDMSLSSKYIVMKNFSKRLIKFKNIKPTKSETQLKRKQIMENVAEIYRKYYDVYKDEDDNGWLQTL